MILLINYSYWELVDSAMAELGLPLRALDRGGVQQGRFRPTFNFLVMLCVFLIRNMEILL
jgi:hypothetical protein